MPEWTTYKGQNPWALEQQGNKFGYVNNPNFRFPATKDHNPCGYWSKGERPRTADFVKTVWYVDGSAVPMTVLEVGAGKEYETFASACTKASSIAGSVLLLVFPGSYESGSIISGSNRTVYVRGMGSSPLDVEFLNCCPQVSGTGHNLFLENIYIHYETGAGFTSLQFSALMGDLTLNKVYLSDPNVPVEYTPFLAGLTWAGSLTASYCTIAATFNWELVFFQFSPSKISFNKVSYVGGYWGDSSCAVQFATYNPAISDCGALYGSFRITEEIETETMSLTPLWPLTRWQTFDKDLPPWIARPITSLRYNEGDKIAIAPPISGGSPVWDMEHNGNNITDLHDPCKYWYTGDWYKAYLRTKLCESINIDYTSATMITDASQTLSLEDSNGNAVTADIAVWFLTGVGSLTGEVGSSVIYNAPSTVTEEANTATIEVWCDGVLRDTLVITIAQRCDETNTSIGYTSAQMSINQQQNLTLVGCDSDTQCEWSVDHGSLSSSSGISVIYTAPATNANCTNNATVTVTCNGVVVDTLQIAIDAAGTYGAYYMDSNCRYETWASGCARRYRKTRTTYYCNGAVSRTEELVIYAVSTGDRDDCDEWAEALLQATCNANYGQACCAYDPNCSPYQPMCAIKDTRSAAQILAGCCPAALL